MFNLVEWLYFKQKNNLAFNDVKYNIKNNNYWHYKAKRKLAKQKCFVTMIDINFLKDINDSKGHAAGDQLIRKIIYKIEHTFIDDKHLLVKWGGDELLLVTASDPKMKLIQINSNESFSFGVYQKREYTDIDYAVHLADMKMYKYKKILHSKKKI